MNICSPLLTSPGQSPCLKPWWKLRTFQSSFFTQLCSTLAAKAESFAADVSAGDERLERRLRREHAGLEAEMDALEAHAVQEAGGLPRDQQAVAHRGAASLYQPPSLMVRAP